MVTARGIQGSESQVEADRLISLSWAESRMASSFALGVCSVPREKVRSGSGVRIEAAVGGVRGGPGEAS